MLTIGVSIFVNSLKAFSTTAKIGQKFWKWYLHKFFHAQYQEKTQDSYHTSFVAYEVLTVVW